MSVTSGQRWLDCAPPDPSRRHDPSDQRGSRQRPRVLAAHDDLPEVLTHLQQHRQQIVVAHFVDATGNRIFIRCSQQEAFDLDEVLGEALPID
jgi:hypothetical protein